MSRLFKLNLTPFYSPDDIPSIGGSGDLGKEDIVDILNEDDNDEQEDDKETVRETEDKREPKKKGSKEKSEASDEEDVENLDEIEELDEEELEKEIKGPTEEDLELVTPEKRSKILAKYPNLFKDFPYLEKAYYREQQYTEIVPTIEDARIAVDKARTLDNFESEVLGGKTETLLKAVQSENPEGFKKLVDDYLPTLSRVDPQAYYHVVGNVAKHTIMAMVQEARKSNNNNLQAAAQILNQFVFGSSDFQAPENFFKGEAQADNKQENQISEREQNFMKRQFDTALDNVNTRVNNILKNTVESNIDPKGSMDDYVKRNATRDALENLSQLTTNDKRFRLILDKLWENAHKDNYSQSSMDKIKSAYLSKAKTLLPAVIKKARNEALGTRTRNKSANNQESTEDNGPLSTGRPRSETRRGKISDPKDIPSGMSSLDFLMQD